jgi:type I restriction enzyme M protein
MFVPLRHEPGHAQVDFGEALAVIGGVEQKIHFFAMDLPHSDACLVQAYPAETTEAFCEGHIVSFEFFGGVPRSILYDNLKLAVARILGDGGRQRTRVFSELQSHYLFADRFGRPAHVFTLSQVYEGLLLKMGEKGNDGGQFFTPREIIRAMVKVIDPKIGETVYDPGCGTGGFLAQSYEHMTGPSNANITSPAQLEILKQQTFYGREKDNAIYPIALANLVLHNIDEPHIWHGNTLTGGEIYSGLFDGAPALYDVVLMNPPFGGKEGKEAQTGFSYKTGATQVLFLQHVIDSLKPGGRCGIVLDEGVLFRNNETAFVQTKRKLLDDCDLWCIVSLPGGVFTSAGAGVKTNLLFFTRGGPTEKIWYYDLSDIKVGKKTPLTLERFNEFFRLLPDRADSERSWTISRAEINAKNYDLKAVNPNRKSDADTRTPEELLDLIENKGREVAEALASLRVMTKSNSAAQ